MVIGHATCLLAQDAFTCDILMSHRCMENKECRHLKTTLLLQVERNEDE